MLVSEPLFNKVAGLWPAPLLKRESNTDVFLEHCEIFMNTYFEEYLRTAASVKIKEKYETRKTTCKTRYFQIKNKKS